MALNSLHGSSLRSLRISPQIGLLNQYARSKLAFKRYILTINSLYNTCLAKHFCLFTLFYKFSSIFERESSNYARKPHNPNRNCSIYLTRLFNSFRFCFKIGFGMQKTSRRIAPRSYLNQLKGRSTTMFVARLVDRWTNLVRRLQRQHHPCLASVGFGISLRYAFEKTSAIFSQNSCPHVIDSGNMIRFHI